MLIDAQIRSNEVSFVRAYLWSFFCHFLLLVEIDEYMVIQLQLYRVSKIMKEYPDWASPGPPQKVKVHGLGLP